MDLQTAFMKLVDVGVRSYRQGKELIEGYVYLCCCHQTAFDLLPWKSKKIYEEFTKRLENESLYFYHVIVKKEEWFNWLRIEGQIMKTEGELIPWDDDDDVPSCKSRQENPEIKLYVAPLQPFVIDIKSPKKKETIEWQRKRLVKILRRILRQKEKAEKMEQKQTKKTEQNKPEWLTRVLEKRDEKSVSPAPVQKKVVVTSTVPVPEKKIKLPPQEDPDINSYAYDLTIEVIGEMWVFTRDVEHRIRITTGKYKARKCGLYLVIRDPSGKKVEYGLMVNQWKQYTREDMPNVTVILHGL